MTAPKSREKKGKFGEFLSSNRFILLSFLAPSLIMALNFMIKSFFPFGDRMILVTDCWHQYYPFLAEYQRMLKEGAFMLYSWNTGGGANFIGVIANYLGSPLYLLSYFVPSGSPWLQVFLAFTVVLRIGLAGMFFSLFLRKVFGRNNISLVSFSLMYAFCAFIMGYYWNMMWLDTVALIPLVIAGVVGVLRDKEFSLYTVALALSVLFNFYMGYMVCIFVLLFSIAYTAVSFVSFKESLKNAGRMLLYTVVAFMLTAFITFPAFEALRCSDSAGVISAFPKEYTVNKGFGYEGDNQLLNTVSATMETLTNLLSYNHPLKMDVGAPNIACSVLALVLIVFYFITKKISLRERIVSGVLCAFMVMSFIVNQLNYIWHGMATPAMVYYRFSFIFSFILIVLAYRAYTFIDTVSKKRFILVSAVLSLYLVAAFFLHRHISVYITLCLAVLILILVILMRKRVISFNVFSLLLCIVMLAESFLSAFVGVATVGNTVITDYPANKTEVEKLRAMCLPEDEFYRTEFTSWYTLNDGDIYDTFGISTFNSMVNKSYTDFLTEFGIAGSKVNNRYAYFETTPVFNLFLNVRYIFGLSGEKAVDSTFMKKMGDIGDCTLYENNAYVPMGFMVSEKLLETELHEDWVSPFEVQNKFFSDATGIEQNVLEFVPLASGFKGEYSDAVSRIAGFEDYYNVSLEDKTPKSRDDIIFTAEYRIEDAGSYYGIFKNSSVNKAYVTINGDAKSRRELDESYTYVAAAGRLEKGDILTVELPAKAGEDSKMFSCLYRVDEELLRQGAEKLSESTMELTSKTNTSVKGRINVKESGLFYTSILYDEGFRAFVDGKEVEITPVADTFIAFPLSEGEHTIELKFYPKGLNLGVCVSCVGAAAFALIVFYRRKRNKRSYQSDPNVTDAPRNCDDSVNK